MAADEDLDRFMANRPRLLGLAYRMLGEASAAEDVLQDAWLRWAARSDVDSPEGWLTTVVVHLCLNRLDSARSRRERYVGPWLPEPVLTDDGALGPAETVEQRESLSMAALVLLERLTPQERAAFVLREAFGYPHAGIAEILGVDPANARQLFRRARERVGSGPRRFTVQPGRDGELVLAFLAAVGSGDAPALARMLAADAVATADGGGRVSASRRPVAGRDRVSRYLVGVGGSARMATARVEVRAVNGGPAVLVHEDGRLSVAVLPQIVRDEIVGVALVVNPDKLAFLSAQLA